jgi:polyphosphate kinase
LRPGVPGVSENIRVFSIVGRFLEHERVFVFGGAREDEYFLSSADWMPRNLHRRVEVLVPILAPALREQIQREVVLPALADNCCAYDMNAEGQYHRRQSAPGQTQRSAQLDVLLGAPADEGVVLAPEASARVAMPVIDEAADPPATDLTNN